MGKTLIQQARGRGGPTYRVRRGAYRFRVHYPTQIGEAEILSLLHSAGHTAPLMKLKINNEFFYNPAFNGAYTGKGITIGLPNTQEGNILMLKDVQVGTRIYNIELTPGDGGKIMRAAGTAATLTKKDGDQITIALPNKKEIILNSNCRATIGVVAGSGRILKPFVTAGRKFYKMKARNKHWPRTSAVKMNVVDHPFGSGRGKRIKQKIAKRNAPPGSKVGHIRPRRTGKRK